MTGILLTNVILAFAWAFMTGSFTLPNLVFGFVLSTFALWLIREQHGTVSYLGRVWRVSTLAVLFFTELVKSSVRVAGLAFLPKLEINPGFVAFPLTADRDIEITFLANLITLTPGTLSVDVSTDRKTLYIHCIDVPDPEAMKQEIADGFERRIMEAFR